MQKIGLPELFQQYRLRYGYVPERVKHNLKPYALLTRCNVTLMTALDLSEFKKSSAWPRCVASGGKVYQVVKN